MQLNNKAFAWTVSLFSGVLWFLMMTGSLLTGLGVRTVTGLGSLHPFFSYSWLGMILIVIEHLVGGFIFGWIFAWLYNKMLKRGQTPPLQ